MFPYRYWVLRGIGGYKTNSGAATVLQVDPLRSLRGLFFREWAFLFFPINWSSDLELWVKLSIAIFLAFLCGVLWYSRSRRTYLPALLFMTVAASLPVQHLILLSQDLAGSRVLYLPMLAVSVLWGFLLQDCRRQSTVISLSIVLIASQAVILEHNLLIWRQAAFLSRKTCHSLGEALARTGENAIVAALPQTWHGVYFLRNGFSACVAMNSRASADQVQVSEYTTNLPGKTRVFFWNSVTERLEEKMP